MWKRASAAGAVCASSGPLEAVKRSYTLIVTDTSPLITLALAGELDLLLRPGTLVTRSLR
jgi:hypothetical protein